MEKLDGNQKFWLLIVLIITIGTLGICYTFTLYYVNRIKYMTTNGYEEVQLNGTTCVRIARSYEGAAKAVGSAPDSLQHAK